MVFFLNSSSGVLFASIRGHIRLSCAEDSEQPFVDFCQAGKLITQLLKRLTEAKSFGDRKGAAFGLAGIVKGLGIKSLKQYAIIDKLGKAVHDVANAKSREGALFAVLICYFCLLFSFV